MFDFTKLILALIGLSHFHLCIAQILSLQEPIDFNISMKDEWCKKAFNSLEEGKYEVAHAYFTVAIELDSSFVLPYFGRIQSKIGENNLSAAWNDYENLIQLDIRFQATDLAKDYTDSTFYGVLASHGYHFSDNSYQVSPTSKNDEYFEDLLASIAGENLQLPVVAFTPYEQGLYYLNEDKPTKALHNFDKALSIDQDHKDAYLQRGRTKTLLRDFEGAFDDYEKALELSPPHWEIYYFRGLTHLAINNILLALIDFDKSIATHPNHAEVYIERAKVHKLLTNYDAVLKDYERALELSPNLSDVYLHRGIFHLENDNIEAACEDWKKAAEQKDKPSVELRAKYCE